MKLVNNPTKFTGDCAKAQEFIGEVELVFAIYGNKFPNDREKIAFTLSYIKGGTAGVWARAYLNLVTTNQLRTWAEFKLAFKKEFNDTSICNAALAKLATLTQKGSFDEYVADLAIIQLFMRGLNPALLTKMAGLEKMPTTIHEFITKAATFKSQYQMIKAIRPRTFQPPQQ